MATVTSLAKASTSTTGAGASTPSLVEYSTEINFAEALTAKGSALAAADVIEAIRIPAGSVVLAAGIQTIAVDDATTLTLDLGVTGGDVDQWVDGYDQAAAAAGAFAAAPVTAAHAVFTASDTIDVLFATLTGTLTVGKIRVWAAVLTFKENPVVGIAALGS